MRKRRSHVCGPARIGIVEKEIGTTLGLHREDGRDPISNPKPPNPFPRPPTTPPDPIPTLPRPTPNPAQATKLGLPSTYGQPSSDPSPKLGQPRIPANRIRVLVGIWPDFEKSCSEPSEIRAGSVGSDEHCYLLVPASPLLLSGPLLLHSATACCAPNQSEWSSGRHAGCCL